MGKWKEATTEKELWKPSKSFKEPNGEHIEHRRHPYLHVVKNFRPNVGHIARLPAELYGKTKGSHRGKTLWKPSESFEAESGGTIQFAKWTSRVLLCPCTCESGLDVAFFTTLLYCCTYLFAHWTLNSVYKNISSYREKKSISFWGQINLVF